MSERFSIVESAIALIRCLRGWRALFVCDCEPIRNPIQDYDPQNRLAFRINTCVGTVVFR